MRIDSLSCKPPGGKTFKGCNTPHVVVRRCAVPTTRRNVDLPSTWCSQVQRSNRETSPFLSLLTRVNMRRMSGGGPFSLQGEGRFIHGHRIASRLRQLITGHDPTSPTESLRCTFHEDEAHRPSPAGNASSGCSSGAIQRIHSGENTFRPRPPKILSRHRPTRSMVRSSIRAA